MNSERFGSGIPETTQIGRLHARAQSAYDERGESDGPPLAVIGKRIPLNGCACLLFAARLELALSGQAKNRSGRLSRQSIGQARVHERSEDSSSCKKHNFSGEEL